MRRKSENGKQVYHLQRFISDLCITFTSRSLAKVSDHIGQWLKILKKKISSGVQKGRSEIRSYLHSVILRKLRYRIQMNQKAPRPVPNPHQRRTAAIQAP